MSFLTLQPRQRQQHTVTPRLQHAVRLLQLSSLDFAQEVHDAMGRNPFLEVEDSPHDAAHVDVGPAAGDGDIGALDMIPADVGLRQHLHGQINVLPLEQRDHALACAIIESLDDDGYLRVALDELAETSGMSPAVEDAEMQIALKGSDFQEGVASFMEKRPPRFTGK